MTAYTRGMKQTATYWAPGANDGFGGVAYDAPTAIVCRWENKATLFKNQQGQEVTSEAIVYVDRVLAVRGYLYLGASADSNPLAVSGAREISQIGQSPSLAADMELNKVYL